MLCPNNCLSINESIGPTKLYIFAIIGCVIACLQFFSCLVLIFLFQEINIYLVFFAGGVLSYLGLQSTVIWLLEQGSLVELNIVFPIFNIVWWGVSIVTLILLDKSIARYLERILQIRMTSRLFSFSIVSFPSIVIILSLLFVGVGVFLVVKVLLYPGSCDSVYNILFLAVILLSWIACFRTILQNHIVETTTHFDHAFVRPVLSRVRRNVDIFILTPTFFLTLFIFWTPLTFPSYLKAIFYLGIFLLDLTLGSLYLLLFLIYKNQDRFLKEEETVRLQRIYP